MTDYTPRNAHYSSCVHCGLTLVSINGGTFNAVNVRDALCSVADDSLHEPTQCTWNRAPDPASGCDEVATVGDVCETHAAAYAALIGAFGE